jgi:LemA protein
LTGALKSLFALSESYPELKANENFLSLQNDLAEVEDKIQAARRYYNGVVRDNNTKVDQFPNNLVARGFTFIKAEFFELEESEAAARQPVPVSFD